MSKVQKDTQERNGNLFFIFFSLRLPTIFQPTWPLLFLSLLAIVYWPDYLAGSRATLYSFGLLSVVLLFIILFIGANYNNNNNYDN